MREPRATPDAYLIAEAWHGDFVLDMGEPSCFACGWWDKSAPTAPDVKVRTAWKKSGLERAHLVPRQFGGSHDPTNFVMLCGWCHREAPDTPSRDLMLAWVRSQPHYGETMTYLAERLGLTADDARLAAELALAETPDGEQFRAAVLGNIGVHCGVSPATFMASIKLSLGEGLLAGAR